MISNRASFSLLLGLRSLSILSILVTPDLGIREVRRTLSCVWGACLVFGVWISLGALNFCHGEKTADDFARGKILLDAGNLKEARRHLEAAVKKDPRSLEAWRLLGTCCHQMDNAKEAERCFREAHLLAPSSESDSYWLTVAAECGNLREFRLTLGAGRFEAANDRLADYLDGGGTVQVLLSDLQMHFSRAFCALVGFPTVVKVLSKDKQWDSAEKTIEIWLAYVPEAKLTALSYLGAVHLLKGNREQAMPLLVLITEAAADSSAIFVGVPELEFFRGVAADYAPLTSPTRLPMTSHTASAVKALLEVQRRPVFFQVLFDEDGSLANISAITGELDSRSESIAVFILRECMKGFSPARLGGHTLKVIDTLILDPRNGWFDIIGSQ